MYLLFYNKKKLIYQILSLIQNVALMQLNFETDFNRFIFIIYLLSKLILKTYLIKRFLGIIEYQNFTWKFIRYTIYV